MKELNCYELQTNCWPPRSPEFTAARCRWPDLGIVYNSEKQNAKDHNTVSRYSITHLIDLNCRKLKLHVTTSVSFFACPLKEFWNCYFWFLGFLFLVKYIKSWFRKNLQYSQKTTKTKKHDKSSRLFSS